MIKDFSYSEINIKFATFPMPKPCMTRWIGRETDILKKRRLLDVLFQATQNFATSKFCRNKATVDVRGVCYSFLITFLFMSHKGEKCIRVHISAWASALLVQQNWAMRRP